MSADEAALCEAAYRAQTAANLDARSAFEAAVEAAEKEASEFVEENATEYRKLKVLFARKKDVVCEKDNDGNASSVARRRQRSSKDLKVQPSRRVDIQAWKR